MGSWRYLSLCSNLFLAPKINLQVITSDSLCCALHDYFVYSGYLDICIGVGIRWLIPLQFDIYLRPWAQEPQKGKGCPYTWVPVWPSIEGKVRWRWGIHSNDAHMIFFENECVVRIRGKKDEEVFSYVRATNKIPKFSYVSERSISDAIYYC